MSWIGWLRTYPGSEYVWVKSNLTKYRKTLTTADPIHANTNPFGRRRCQRRASPTGQMNSPISDEKVPTTAAPTAAAITRFVRFGRSRKYKARASDNMTRYQA